MDQKESFRTFCSQNLATGYTGRHRPSSSSESLLACLTGSYVWFAQVSPASSTLAAALHGSHAAPSMSIIKRQWGKNLQLTNRHSCSKDRLFLGTRGDSGVGVALAYLSPGNGELLLTLLTVCCFIILQPCVALKKKKHLRASPHVSPCLPAPTFL